MRCTVSKIRFGKIRAVKPFNDNGKQLEVLMYFNRL